MTERYQDRTVLITGAGGGLGRALALGYASEGAQLILTDVDQSLLAETEAQVGAYNVGVESHLLDLIDEAAIQAFGAKICAAHPKLHLLYNNAGIAYGAVTRPVEAINQADWLRYFAINSVAPVLLSTALRSALAAAQGVILNQSSMAAAFPSNGYGVTKATLQSMTYGLASAFGADGIRVNAIAPGLMETPASTTELPPETQVRIQAMQMLKGHGLPDDIVKLALFLGSDDARFITCDVFHCDAGNRVRGWRE